MLFRSIPPEPIFGHFDHRLLLQAFTNIVKNAGEAIEAVPPEALGKGRIEVAIRVEEGFVVTEVVDNGIGLPSENRHRLLEPYVTTREKGTGLGLAIVRKILEEHGGRIELVDAPAVAEGGRGTLVRLVLPLAEPSEGVDQSGPAAGEGTPPAPSGEVGDAAA